MVGFSTIRWAIALLITWGLGLATHVHAQTLTDTKYVTPSVTETTVENYFSFAANICTYSMSGTYQGCPIQSTDWQLCGCEYAYPACPSQYIKCFSTVSGFKEYFGYGSVQAVNQSPTSYVLKTVAGDPKHSSWQLNPSTPVTHPAQGERPLRVVMQARYVKLAKPVVERCDAIDPKGPFQSLDGYLRKWSEYFPMQGKLDVSAAVEIFLADPSSSQFSANEPSLIAEPKKCAGHFTELAKKFGGKLDAKRFVRDLRESITAALAEELKDQSSHPTSPDDKTRLMRAENLAKAWLEPNDTVRQQLTDFLDKLDK